MGGCAPARDRRRRTGGERGADDAAFRGGGGDLLEGSREIGAPARDQGGGGGSGAARGLWRRQPPWRARRLCAQPARFEVRRRAVSPGLRPSRGVPGKGGAPSARAGRAGAEPDRARERACGRGGKGGRHWSGEGAGMACGRDGRSRGRGDRAGAGGGVCRTAPAASSGGTGEGRAGGFRALVKCGGGAAWKRGQGLREAGRGPRSAAAEQGAQARRAEKGDVCKVGRRRGLGAGAGGVVRKGDVRKAGGRAVRERTQAAARKRATTARRGGGAVREDAGAAGYPSGQAGFYKNRFGFSGRPRIGGGGARTPVQGFWRGRPGRMRLRESP